MLQSHVIEVNGTFVGAAIMTITDFRFRAVHLKAEDLDDSTWRSLDELSRAVQHLFTTSQWRAARKPITSDPLRSAASSLLLASATRATS